MNNTLQTFDEFGVMNKTKGAWVEICYANVIGLMCLAAAFFLLPWSLILSLSAFIYLEPGIYGFALKSIRKEKPGFEEIFLPLKALPKIFALKLVYMASIMLWGLLLVVPGIVVALNYAFVPVVYFENEQEDIRFILNQSKMLTNGKRLKIMLMFLVALIFVCIGVAVGFGIYMLIGLFTTVPIWAFIILMIFFGGLATIFVALPFYEGFLVSCYEEAKKDAEQAKLSKGEKQVKKVVNKK